MCKVTSFPSAIAHILDSEWRDTDEPAQFEYQQKRVAVGSIVHSQRLSAIKRMNIQANDEQFDQMLIGSMIHAGVQGEINIVCGFPRLTLQSNVESLKAYKDKEYIIKTPKGVRNFTIRNIWPVYESVGHALGVRYRRNIDTNIFALSIGFGTVEGVLLDSSGKPVLSNIFSERLGTHRAAQLLKGKLVKEGIRVPADGGDDLWYDNVMVRAYERDEDLNIVASNGVVPLETLRSYAIDSLKSYADGLLIPKLKAIFDDMGATKTSFALTGGGSLYTPIADSIREFVQKIGFKWVDVDTDLALQSAALGYAVAAKSRGGEFSQRTLAVDFGNSNTVFAHLV